MVTAAQRMQTFSSYMKANDGEDNLDLQWREPQAKPLLQVGMRLTSGLISLHEGD